MRISDWSSDVCSSDLERAARVFMSRISGRYAVDRAILFGSRARRTHNATSDADIAVVLKGEHGKRSTTAIDMAGIAFDVMLETGILVEALPLWGRSEEHTSELQSLMSNSYDASGLKKKKT